MHVSAFVDFVNMFIRYRSRHHTLELSVMASEIVSTTLFSSKEVIVERKSQ